jgi:peptidoglycan/LPS O-acetylase OafA/YrhL
VLSTVLAFGLLFGAIEALHGQKNHQKRLAILAGFVLAFAVCVALFTGAKRTDIFAATAAYAAVLVVYVSGPGSGDSSSSGTA